MKLKQGVVLSQLEIDELMGVFADHFEYSIKDINSYKELTEEERKIIPEWLFDKITEKNNDRHKDNLAIIRRIVEIIDNYPELRFQQILYIYNIVEYGKDKFYEESSKTLSDLNKNICNKNK